MKAVAEEEEELEEVDKSSGIEKGDNSKTIQINHLV